MCSGPPPALGGTRGVRGGRGKDLETSGERFDQQINEFACAAAVRIFVRIVLRDVQAKEILVLGELDQGGSNIVQAQAAAAGNVHGRKIFLGDDVDIEVQDKFASVGMDLNQRIVGGFCSAPQQNIRSVHVPHRRFGEELLLGGIEAL